jgi:hypothetical protein
MVRAPASNEEISVAQVYPIDIARKIERRWQHRFPMATSRTAKNDNRAGGGLCPMCKGYGAIATTPTEYCGKGLVRRHWQCRACGHPWVTELHVHA